MLLKKLNLVYSQEAGSNRPSITLRLSITYENKQEKLFVIGSAGRGCIPAPANVILLQGEPIP